MNINVNTFGLGPFNFDYLIARREETQRSSSMQLPGGSSVSVKVISPEINQELEDFNDKPARYALCTFVPELNTEAIDIICSYVDGSLPKAPGELTTILSLSTSARTHMFAKSILPSMIKPPIFSSKPLSESINLSNSQNSLTRIVQGDTNITSLVDAEKKYSTFVQKLNESAMSPLDDKPDNLRNIKDQFIACFKASSETQKREIASKPLIAKLDPDFVRPLNYIFFSGDASALKLLDPYLTPADYQRKGPFESTFMHCLLSGIEKTAPTTGIDEGFVNCAKFLLHKDKEFATQPNGYGTTPRDYAETIVRDFTHNISHIQRHGGGGFGGMGNLITTTDGQNEYADTYEIGLEIVKKIIKLL